MPAIYVCARVCRGSVSQYQAEKNEIERVTEEQGRRQLSLKGERPSRRRRSVSGIMQSHPREYDESKLIREGRDKRIRSGGELLPERNRKTFSMINHEKFHSCNYAIWILSDRNFNWEETRGSNGFLC